MPKSAVLNLTPEERRYALKGRLKEALADPSVTEASLFQEFYHDPSGRDYWASWLTEQHEDLGSFVDLLAVHNAKTCVTDPPEIGLAHSYQNKAFHRPIYRALIDAAKRGEPWLYGDASPLRDGSFEKSGFSLFTLAGKIEVARRAMVEWLSGDPNYQCLVPTSARVDLQQAEEPVTALAVTSERVAVRNLDPLAVRKRGRKPTTMERVKSAMRQMPPADLDRMPNKELPHRFGAGRTLVEQARREVLSEIDIL